MSFSDITQNKTSQFRCIIMTTLAAFYNKFHIWLSTTFFDFETVNGVKFENCWFCVHEIRIFVLCLTLSEWDIGYRRIQLSWQDRCKWQIVMTFYAINITSFIVLFSSNFDKSAHCNTAIYYVFQYVKLKRKITQIKTTTLVQSAKSKSNYVCSTWP